MTKPAFRTPLTQLENVVRLRYPFVRIIRAHQRRPRPGLLRLRAMEKRLCRPFFRGSSPLFWLVLAYRQLAFPAWTRIRTKLLDVGRLSGQRAFRPDQPHAPFRERFEIWAEKSRCPCRETGHDWQEDCDEPGQWACVRCKQETTSRGPPPSHRFLSPVPHALGIERYLDWRRQSRHCGRSEA